MPTREPIGGHYEGDGCVYHDTPNPLAPQPTAQAGEACPACRSTHGMMGRIGGIQAQCRDDWHGKVPAPPTPSAGEHQHDADCKIVMVIRNTNITEGVAIYKQAVADEKSVALNQASPQLPTPELDDIFSDLWMYAEQADDKFNEELALGFAEAKAAITQLYNQRFEAAIKVRFVCHNVRAIKERWYEGGTNHE